MDEERLMRLILELEDELWEQGLDPKGRHFMLPEMAMKRLGYIGFVSWGRDEPQLLKRIRRLHDQLYRNRDVAIGVVHGGAFMFRGIAAEVYVPLMYGRVRIDPLKLNDLSPHQVDWLRSDEEAEINYFDNFCNLFDFAASIAPFGGYREVSKTALPWLQLAAFQSQSAGATLCASYDGRGAIQSSLLATELSLKAALAGAGTKETVLKGFGHDFGRLAQAVGEAYPAFELRSVVGELRKLPEMVPNRYSETQPDRIETGEIVMASQAVAGAVARVLTGGSFRHLARPV